MPRHPLVGLFFGLVIGAAMWSAIIVGFLYWATQ